MIGRLTGVLVEKQPPHLLIDVRGVGYEAQAPMTSFYPLPEVGGEVALYTHFSVSESSQKLFAFYTSEERQLFRLLIKVNGVGPKTALGILSGMAVGDFIHCVLQGNAAVLSKAPGIGKKTAERLIIEIKHRLDEIGQPLAADQNVMDAHVVPTAGTNTVIADAKSALIALGYRPAVAAKMIASATQSASMGDSINNSEQLIKLALRNLV